MRIQEHTDLSRVGQHIHLFEKSFLCKFEEAPPEQLNKRGTDQTVNKVLAAQYSDGVCGALLMLSCGCYVKLALESLSMNHA